MYCPSCGSEERQLSQYCRACGTDLRGVRAGLERPDAVTNSAITARDEIGRAIAAKIRELDSGRDLKHMAEDILPKIEEFLESPEEKRLRRMRTGVITSAIGLGSVLMFMMVALATGQEELLVMVGAGLIAFLIGLGILINGKLLTIPKKRVEDHSPDAMLQQALDNDLPARERKEFQPSARPPASVIEHTTHRLSNEPITPRAARTQD